MGRLVLLLGLCLLLALSASGLASAGTMGAVSDAPAAHDHSAHDHSAHDHRAHAHSDPEHRAHEPPDQASPVAERPAGCPDENHDADCLAAGHCLSGPAGRYALAGAPAVASRPPPPRLRQVLSPRHRLERPPRAA